jgi:hypothetical protein
MARVTFMNAIVSGKVGGTVYAHNKGGSYMRILRRPTNPKSVSQVQARGSFGSGSNIWRACTAAQRAAYNTFATTFFNPLKARPGVLYSGQQSANALSTACIASDLLIRTTVMKIATVTSTNTYGVFAALTDPPAYRLAANIASSTGAPLNLALKSATLKKDGTATFTLNADNTIAVQPAFNNPGQTEKIGFGLYMSNPFGGGQSFVTNKFYKFIGSTGPVLTSTVTIITPSPVIEIDFTGTELVPGNMKTWITIGNKVRLTAVMISASGQQTDIGSIDFTVVA